ncbi:MAG: tRNA adenosine(34) deaminase TadA [Clostridia bacterium]|jgi:tRNA(adenine34) deaminase|uniref:tRNA adenosine(34) deaminase TadA n=1 Tax=Petroclostridium xylanilyticum TaxID=1792311 RepID=UPI000B987086|nr:tRNA adenosine(34) deaminase TadA [Petroclostridium xylanilyticum]MBZ4646165.1 tRNA adenosine(34) deaminase TadA [Clostridia bacterium]
MKIIRDDQYYMVHALKEAQKAYEKGEVPIGAIIVKDDKIIARVHNLREKKKDATAHAEILAIQKACKKLGSWRLNGCDLYVTLEPCPMCAGAIIQSRIRRLIIGTTDPKAGAAGSVVDLFSVETFNHKVEVVQGILQAECSMILKQFFKELRQKS